jgi:hypothetical protein
MPGDPVGLARKPARRESAAIVVANVPPHWLRFPTASGLWSRIAVYLASDSMKDKVRDPAPVPPRADCRHQRLGRLS